LLFVFKRSKFVALDRCGSGKRALEGLSSDWCSQVDVNQRCYQMDLSNESARNVKFVRVPEFKLDVPTNRDRRIHSSLPHKKEREIR